MTEEEVTSVTNQESAVPEAKSEEINEGEVNQTQTERATEPEKGSKEYNFARLREKNEGLQGQIKELRQEMSQWKEKQTTQKEEPDELSKLADDDILTVAQANKLAQRQAETIVKKAMQEKEYATLPAKTRVQFNDFDQVMTEENIKKLEQTEPGLAAACAKAPNPWEATYKIMKKFIVSTDEVTAKKGEEKMNENLSKPVSSNTTGRPLANANLWSQSSQDELYKEMMQSARSAQ